MAPPSTRSDQRNASSSPRRQPDGCRGLKVGPHAPGAGCRFQHRRLLGWRERDRQVPFRPRRLAICDRISRDQSPSNGAHERAGDDASYVPDRLCREGTCLLRVTVVPATLQQPIPFAVEVKRGDLAQWAWPAVRDRGTPPDRGSARRSWAPVSVYMLGEELLQEHAERSGAWATTLAPALPDPASVALRSAGSPRRLGPHVWWRSRIP